MYMLVCWRTVRYICTLSNFRLGLIDHRQYMTSAYLYVGVACMLPPRTPERLYHSTSPVGRVFLSVNQSFNLCNQWLCVTCQCSGTGSIAHYVIVLWWAIAVSLLARSISFVWFAALSVTFISNDNGSPAISPQTFPFVSGGLGGGTLQWVGSFVLLLYTLLCAV